MANHLFVSDLGCDGPFLSAFVSLLLSALPISVQNSGFLKTHNWPWSWLWPLLLTFPTVALVLVPASTYVKVQSTVF